MGTVGTKLSTSVRNSSANEANGSPSTTSTSNFGILGHGQRTGTSAADARQRTRSLTSVLHVNRTSSQPLGIPSGPGAILGGPGSPDSETSTPDDASFNRVFAAHSLPAQLMSLNGIKCPVCSRFLIPDDVEYHLVMCLTKPRINYNEDVLSEAKGECVICLEELAQGDTIARLPCLCIYHKVCIDSWFQVNRSCPEHPND